jgi:hypothetical protein
MLLYKNLAVEDVYNLLEPIIYFEGDYQQEGVTVANIFLISVCFCLWKKELQESVAVGDRQ